MEKLQNLAKHSGLIALCLIALSSGLSLGYSMCMAGMLTGLVFITLVGLLLFTFIFFESQYSERIITFNSVAASFLFSIFLGIGIFFFSVEAPTVIDPNPEMELELQQCNDSIANAKKALAQQ